ncbi:MAG: TrkH family potassium uptake protein [Natronohydrobacter sp.]|nr:TrkH family potassium uptake protein [Natronohydrobacter sp.]
MLDLRPVFHLIGLLSLTLGVLMLIPAAVDWQSGNDNWHAFARASFLVCLIGGAAAMATRQALADGLGRRQSFLLTASVWAVLPALGALPFIFGAPHASPTHALFEALSGMTTTGTTVFIGLDDLPPGVLLWRSMLQWLGGLGIIIVALVFLPILRVGGMQHFQAEAFDTMGKVLPRVYDISMGLLQVYIALTLAAAMSYMAYGMDGFDAVNHAMTTIATGGFSTSDQSFARFTGALEYVAVLYMILAGLPFIRFVQLVGGSWTPLFRDVQVRAFLRWSAYAVLAIIAYRLVHGDGDPLDVLRGTLFNVVTLFTGTGYGSEAVDDWGDFPLLVVVLMGFIGACTASTGCSLKVFRYLVLFEAIRAQMQRLRRPHEVVSLKLGGKRLEDDVVSSVIVMFTVFIASFMLLTVALSMTGLELRTAITAAWTAICNVGPVFGPEVGATGAVDGFPEAAKWLMMLGMYLGRLEVLAVMVLLLPRFWRG